MEYQPFSTTPGNEGFQVKKSIRQKLANSKRRIQRRLDKTDLRGCSKPILTASNIHYEIAQRTRGLSVGGIGAINERRGDRLNSGCAAMQSRESWRAVRGSRSSRKPLRLRVI
jgi:hypothetical protein